MLIKRKSLPFSASIVLLALVLTALHSESAAQGQDVSYPAISVSSGQWDCDKDPPAEAVCRVKSFPSGEKLRAQLQGGKAVWREGSELIFAYQGQADSVSISGAFGWPLAQLSGHDLWALILRVPKLDQAMISYQFTISNKAAVRKDPDPNDVWRGPLARSPQRQSSKLRGRVLEETIQSVNLSESRHLSVYVPPLRGDKHLAAVVYLADGDELPEMAKYVDPLIAMNRLPLILLVGIHPGAQPMPYSVSNDRRALEYLTGFGKEVGKDDERFEAHERFVLSEVLPWAEAKFGAPKIAARRAVFGESNGGSFAIEMGLRHPDVFGHVISFSSTWPVSVAAPAWAPKQAPSQFLLVGALERPSTRKLVRDWARASMNRGASVKFIEPVAGHDYVMWREYFPESLRNQFGPRK